MREKEGTLWKSGNACAMIRNRRSRNRTDENLGGMRMKKTLSLLLSLVLMLLIFLCVWLMNRFAGSDNEGRVMV